MRNDVEIKDGGECVGGPVPVEVWRCQMHGHIQCSTTVYTHSGTLSLSWHLFLPYRTRFNVWLDAWIHASFFIVQCLSRFVPSQLHSPLSFCWLALTVKMSQSLNSLSSHSQWIQHSKNTTAMVVCLGCCDQCMSSSENIKHYFYWMLSLYFACIYPASTLLLYFMGMLFNT